MPYPTHLLLPMKAWFALERGPWDADDHGFERPGGAKAQKDQSNGAKPMTTDTNPIENKIRESSF